MNLFLRLLLAASPSLFAGCGSFVTDSVIKPYKLESYERLDDGASVNGVRVSSAMAPKMNHIYDTRGPFSLSVVFSDMRGSDKVAAVRRLEVTNGGDTLFARNFTALRSSHPEAGSAGAKNSTKYIDGVRVTTSSRLSFNFGELFKVEHRPGRVVTVRAIVEVRGGGKDETKELVFRHRPKTKRGVWQWYPPT